MADGRYSLFDKLFTPILLIKDNFDVIFLNNDAKDAYGAESRRPENAQNLKCFAISHGYDRPCYEYGEECPVKNLIDDESIDKSSVNHIHKNGYYKVEAYRNKEDGISFFESHARISDLKVKIDYLEKEMRNTQIFKNFFYDNSYAMFILEPDTSEIMDINSSAIKFYGYSKEEIIGKTIETINPFLSKEAVFNTLDLTLSGKQKVFYYKHRLKDGAIRDVQISLTVIDIQGRRLVLDTVLDITEKIQQEKELKEQKAKAEEVNLYYRALAEANEFMIGKHDRNVVFKQICEIISGINGSFFVWIGLWNGMNIQPVTYSSAIKGSDKVFERITGLNPFEIDDEYPTPAMDAFRTGKPVIVNNYKASTYENNRNNVYYMEALGAEATAAFPLSADGKNVGVLTACAGKDAFMPDIAALLHTLANNMSDKLYLISLEDAEKENKRIIEHLAYHDILTGVPNRAHFLNRIKSVDSRVKRHKLPFALLLIDLDGFKHINDTYGHDTGDKLLIETAKRIKGSLRDEDEMFRMGGDEFTVIADTSKLKSGEDLVAMCDRIIDKINEPASIEGKNMHIGASIGIAFDLDGKTGFEDIMKIADAAMYEAKNGGRNRCELRYR